MNKFKVQRLILLMCSILLFSAVIAPISADAKPVKKQTHSYRGTDGSYYWVEWYEDDVSGDRFSRVYVNGSGNYNHYNGWILPNYPRDKVMDLLATNPDLDIWMLAPDLIEMQGRGEHLDIISPINLQCDIVDITTGKILMSDINIGANDSGQSINLSTLNGNQTYGIIMKYNNEAIKSEIFIFSNHQIAVGK